MIWSHTSKHCSRARRAAGSIAALVAAAGVCAPAQAGVGQTDAAAPISSSLETLKTQRVRVVRELFGTTWVGTDDGLAAFENGAWRRWSIADGLPASRIAAIDMDPATRDLWLGTLGGGLVRFTAGRFDAFNQFNSGLAGDLVFAVACHGGRIYASTNGGLCEFEPIGHSWDVITPRRADIAQPVVVALQSAEGKLFARAVPEGVLAWDPMTRAWNPDPTQSGPSLPKIDNAGGGENLVPGPLSIAILGPGTRRIRLPGTPAAAYGQPARLQPDIAAVRVAFDAARASSTSPDIRLWQPAPGYARYGWGMLEDDLVRDADKADVIGLVAHLDDRQRHTAVSVAYLGLPAVNVAIEPVSLPEPPGEDRSIFQCRKNAPQRHRALLEFVRKLDCDIWLVSEVDNLTDTRLRIAWTKSYEAHHKLKNVTYVLDEEGSQAGTNNGLQHPNRVALFLWGDPVRAATTLKVFLTTGLDLVVAGGPELEKLQLGALTTRAGVRMVIVPDEAPPCAEELVKNYASKPMPAGMPKEPDVLACNTFDGTDHLLAAVRSSPPSRRAVAATLRGMETDIFGELHYEARRGPTTVRLRVLEDGQWQRRDVLVAPLTADSSP